MFLVCTLVLEVHHTLARPKLHFFSFFVNPYYVCPSNPPIPRPQLCPPRSGYGDKIWSY